MKRLGKIILSALCAISTLALPASVANAAEVTDASTSETTLSLTSSEKQELLSELAQYDVSPQTADKLVANLASGQIWDSAIPGSTPVKTEKFKGGDVIRTVDTFKDGSISVSTLPDFDSIASRDGKQTRGISGCQYHASGKMRYWKNCDSTVNLIFISMGFMFNYQTKSHKSPRITSYRAYHHHIIGGSLSGFRFDRISSSKVRLSSNFDVAFRGFPVGWTCWMQVNVTGDNAWTSHN
ncbi:MAG: hypothetical protein LKJ05_06205 [Bifidobacteriaceae bacterium]|nr:hypothetical protein [Bifidobacteriaceae bacterium]